MVPSPHEVRSEQSGFAIEHRPFNAMIPCHYATRGDLNKALSLQLIGGVIEVIGKTDFTYKNQPFKLLESFDLATLPARPELRTDDLSAYGWPYGFGGSGFTAGFTPVSNALYLEIVALKDSWTETTGKARKFVAQASNLWGLAAAFSLTNLNTQDSGTDQIDEIAELRALYPELPMLTDVELHARFDDYQSDCNYINGWTANRDDGFLMYLLGQLACEGKQDGHTSKEVGQIVAYAALRGATTDEALTLGVQWHDYDRALASLERRASTAMRFLQAEQKATALRGGKVTTFLDGLRMMRSTNAGPTTVVQDISTLRAAQDRAADLQYAFQCGQDAAGSEATAAATIKAEFDAKFGTDPEALAQYHAGLQHQAKT